MRLQPTLRTEEEQRQLWCPKATVPTFHDQPTTVNRIREDGSPMQGCNCIASGCACWISGKNLKGKTVGYCGLVNGTVEDEQ